MSIYLHGLEVAAIFLGFFFLAGNGSKALDIKKISGLCVQDGRRMLTAGIPGMRRGHGSDLAQLLFKQQRHRL